jgi:hypothetical protein
MATGAIAHTQRIGRQRDSPATITIVQREELHQGSSAVSSDAVTSAEYVVTLDRIAELNNEAEEEDRPSEYAHDLALKALAETARELALAFPRASVSVGPNRGLRITWSRGPGEVRLVCGGSADNKSYIYSEFGKDHSVGYVVDGRHIGERLRWALRES